MGNFSPAIGPCGMVAKPVRMLRAPVQNHTFTNRWGQFILRAPAQL